MRDPETGCLSETGVCLRDQLAEAIASLRWQTAVMLSHAPGRTTGPEGESSPGDENPGTDPLTELERAVCGPRFLPGMGRP